MRNRGHYHEFSFARSEASLTGLEPVQSPGGRPGWGALAVMVCCCLWAGSVLGAKPLTEFPGTDFQGGANGHFGTAFYGQPEVNYVYAQPTGAAAKMTAAFNLVRAPSAPVFLSLEAMDDDAAAACRIRISLNGHPLFEGPSGFANGLWEARRLPIPRGLLKSGSNRLSIANLEPRGKLGQPPWFMVARCALGDSSFKMSVPEASLEVRLPAKARPIPEPLSPDHPRPGFKFRGIKGWDWTPQQYLDEIPYLAKFKMNFLMNCYLSLFTSKPGEPFKNEWWKPLSKARKRAYARVFRSCREHGITFCFAVHPQLDSPRPLNPASEKDIDQFYQHYAWAQSEGVHWFSVSLDDVSWQHGGPAACGAAHARFVNTILGRLRVKDPGAQLIFCPGPYWGDGTNPGVRAYLEALGRDLDPDVYIFWTGDRAVTPRITVRTAKSYKSIVKHRLFLWDNYPVNDARQNLNLGPVRGRDLDLCQVISGYLSNPMASQDEINRIPMATCADYAYNPWAYDPARSIGQSILHLAKTRPRRRLLQDLVEAYPGFIVTGGGTGTNPVRLKFDRCLADKSGTRKAQDLLHHLKDLDRRLAELFPHEYLAARKTVDADVNWMERQLQDRHASR